MKIEEAIKRPMTYWSEDGVMDLVLGLNFLLVGGLFLIGYELPKGSSFANGYIWLAQAGWLGSSLGMRWGVKALKEHVTAPRGGYVALREPEVKMGMSRRALMVLGVTGVSLLAFITALVVGNGVVGWERFTAPLVGTGFALALAVPGWRYKLPHMLWLAVFSLGLGACVYALQRRFGESLCLMMIGLGMAMAFAGAVRLSSFLASHPMQEGE